MAGRFTPLPGIAALSVDARVIAAAVGVSFVASFVFGLIPALTASQQSVGVALQQEGRSGDGARGSRMRSVLVVAELALSLILLVGNFLLTAGRAREQQRRDVCARNQQDESHRSEQHQHCRLHVAYELIAQGQHMRPMPGVLRRELPFEVSADGVQVRARLLQRYVPP